VLLLEGLHHAVRPRVALPLAQELLASLAAHALSEKGGAKEAAKQQAADPAKHALHLRLVRIAVRVSYGHGIDAALAASAKKAPKLMSPLLDSVHQEAQDPSGRQAHVTADGDGAALAPATRGSGKDRTPRGVWLETLIKCMSPELWQSLDDKACHQLFRDLCSIASKSQANLSKAAKDRLRKLPLSEDHLEKLLASLCDQLQKANSTEHKSAKRGKSSASDGSDAGEASVSRSAVSEAVIVLDALQTHQDPAAMLALLPRLFKVLAAVNESKPSAFGAEDGDESLMQSLLGALLALLQAARAASGAKGKTGKKEAKDYGVDMHALVLCIRTAVSPQTRHEALNCLVELAHSQPKMVLTHVMTIFTFLSERGLVQDDQYSFHVIEHTIKSIVPPLVENGMEPLVLLGVFVNSLPSIPAHRRLRLITTLLMLLEEGNALQVFLTLLLARAKISTAKDAAGSPGVMQEGELISFGVTLFGQFPLEKQLGSMLLVLETIAAMPTSAKGLKGCESTPYSAAAGSVEEIQRLQQRLVQVVGGTLAGRSFVGLLQALPAQEEAAAQDMLLALFEKVLVLQQGISQNVKDEGTELDLTAMDAKSVAEAPLVVQLGRRLDEAQQLVGRHLSVSGFVGTIETLLSRKDEYVQQRALQCFIHKLQLLDSGLSIGLQSRILSLMPLLGKLASGGGSSKGGSSKGKATATDAKRSALVVQLSLNGIEQLVRLFGGHPGNQEALDAVMSAVLSALQHQSASVTTSACACAAAMVWHSSSMMINHVNEIVPGLVAVLESALGALAEANLSGDALLQVQGAMLALDRVVSKIPMLVTPQVKQMLTLLIHPAVVGPDCDSDARAVAQQARQNLVSLVAPRIMVPALERSCKEVLGGAGQKRSAEESAVALMELVEYLCAHLVDKDVTVFYMQLFRLLLGALDVRYLVLSPSSVSEGKGLRTQNATSAHAVESAALKALEALVLKLNENRFKPLFLKMVEWANAREDTAAALGSRGKRKEAQDTEESERQLHVMCRYVVLCRVVDVLGLRLKAIMVPYFSYVMDFLLLVLSARRTLFVPLPRLFSSSPSAPEKSAKKRSRPAESDNGIPDPSAAVRRLRSRLPVACCVGPFPSWMCLLA
jgi:U3 small nucleolar RNA-associated protein 10